MLSDQTKKRKKTQKENTKKTCTVCRGSGVLQVARCGSRAKAPPLAARPRDVAFAGQVRSQRAGVS